MQPTRSCIMGLPFFLVGEGEGGLFFSSCVWCGERTVHCRLSMPTFLFWGGLLEGWGRGKAKSSQVLDMFPQKVHNSTPLLSHMLWQMLSSFPPIEVGEKEGPLYFKIKPSILGCLHSFFLFSVLGQSNCLIAKKN